MIPEHAKKVHSGPRFDVYQWEQELFDGSSTTYERVKRKDSTQVIAVDGDHVLISDEEQSGDGKFLGLFGGIIEDGEEPLPAAKRELLEETGMEAVSWQKLGVFKQEGMLHWDTYIYLAKDLKKVQEIKLDPGERVSIKRIPMEEFLDLCVSNEFRASVVLRWLFAVELKEREKVRSLLTS